MSQVDVLKTVRIATRQSQLAMWQANYLADLLRIATPDLNVELVPVSTIGDRDRSEPLRSMGGQGVFTREVQRVVLNDEADVAVHSLKDLPTDTVDGLTLAGIPERAPRFDALIFAKDSDFKSFADLPPEAKIGTGSPRRQAQLLSARSDLQPAEIRGNVETRLTKLDDGEYDAIILAQAGLQRLGWDDRINETLSPPMMYPAVGQAALGIECRADDDKVISLLQSISDSETRAEVTCERACLATLRAGCHAPVGVHCVVDGKRLNMTTVVLSPDGQERFEVTIEGDIEEPFAVGKQAALQLIEQGASKVL